MDFTILYRVLWKPSAVFKRFAGKLRTEPFVLIAVIAIISGINAYVGRFQEVLDHPVWFPVGLIQSSLILLLPPTIDAVVVFLLVLLLMKVRTKFLVLVSAFVLCEMPYFLERLLAMVFGYPSIGLGSLITILGDIQPFLFGMLATITPFFVWNVILSWVAIIEIFNFQRRQNILLVGSLVLTGMLLNGVWFQVKCMWLK